MLKLCEQCAAEDECALDYDKANEYVDHLALGEPFLQHAVWQ